MAKPIIYLRNQQTREINNMVNNIFADAIAEQSRAKMAENTEISELRKHEKEH
jgi:hypothetical protein